VNFASLNLSPTDASQFTVTSYGTLKTRITHCIPATRGPEALKSQNTSATVVLKTMWLAVLSMHLLKTRCTESVLQLKFKSTGAARQAISQGTK
jgi:hypothetical protein